MQIHVKSFLTELKNSVHGLNEPEVVGSKPLGQLCYLGDQIRADVFVVCLPEVGDELLSYDCHVRRVGHLEEEV